MPVMRLGFGLAYMVLPITILLLLPELLAVEVTAQVYALCLCVTIAFEVLTKLRFLFLPYYLWYTAILVINVLFIVFPEKPFPDIMGLRGYVLKHVFLLWFSLGAVNTCFWFTKKRLGLVRIILAGVVYFCAALLSFHAIARVEFLTGGPVREMVQAVRAITN
jgi:hypothetical protein